MIEHSVRLSKARNAIAVADGERGREVCFIEAGKDAGCGRGIGRD